MKQILEKIKEYDRIMIFRHIRNDGDCVGATKGLKEILRLTWPEKEVYVIDTETAKYLEFMGPEDTEIPDEMYADALGIQAEEVTGTMYGVGHAWNRVIFSDGSKWHIDITNGPILITDDKLREMGYKWKK